MKQYALVAFAFSPWIILLFVVILWLAGGFERPAEQAVALAPTLPPQTAVVPPSAVPATVTREPTPAPTQTPQPTPTISPDERQRALDGYKALVTLQGMTVVLDEATRMSKIERQITLIGAALLLDTTDKTLQQGAPVPALDASWPNALTLATALKDTTAQWFQGKMDTERVIVQLKPITASADSLVRGAEQDLGTAYRVDPAQLQQLREQAISELRAKLQATPTPEAASDTSAPCQPGQIKGNEESKIYHMPGQRDYERTKEHVVCFATEDEAIAAGYRKAER